MWGKPSKKVRGTGPLPTFVIAGMPKAGTTALAAHLQGHPDVFVAPQKEVHFFDTNFEWGVDWYRSQFAGAAGQPAIGDATPTYVATESNIERMASLLPEARVILVVRNPVDRAISHYWWMRGGAGLERRTFEDAVRAEMKDPDGTHTFPHFSYLAGSRYMTFVERLERYYSRESMLVVVGEDLRSDSINSFQTVCRFLGVRDDYEPHNLGADINPSFTRRSQRLHLLMLKTKAWRWLPGAYKLDMANRVPLVQQPIDPSLRHELRDWFAPSVASLSSYMGRDLAAVWTT